jgi:DNA-binding GntR family transcriptional regulator
MFYAPSDAPVDSPEMQSAIAERVIFEHRTIVEAIRSQDASAAADAAKVHVNWVGDLARRVCIAQELKV